MCTSSYACASVCRFVCYVDICVYVNAFVRVCTAIRAYACTMYVYVNTVCMYVCECLCLCVSMCCVSMCYVCMSACMHVCMHVCVCVSVWMYVRVCVCVSMYVDTCMRMCIHDVYVCM